MRSEQVAINRIGVNPDIEAGGCGETRQGITPKLLARGKGKGKRKRDQKGKGKKRGNARSEKWGNGHETMQDAKNKKKRGTNRTMS